MKPTPVDPVAAYIDGFDEQTRAVLRELDRLIRIWQPQLEVELWQSMGFPIIGYGSCRYRLRSGKENRWFIVGLAAHKSYLSLYLWGFVDSRSLVEVYKDRLGQIKAGRACLNFKAVSDLNLEVLAEAVQAAVDSQTQT